MCDIAILDVVLQPTFFGANIELAWRDWIGVTGTCGRLETSTAEEDLLEGVEVGKRCQCREEEPYGFPPPLPTEPLCVDRLRLQTPEAEGTQMSDSSWCRAVCIAACFIPSVKRCCYLSRSRYVEGTRRLGAALLRCSRRISLPDMVKLQLLSVRDQVVGTKAVCLEQEYQ